MAEYYSIICIYHILFIHSSVDGHLSYFHLLAIMKYCCYDHSRTSICLNTYFQFLCGYVPRSGSAGSYGNSMFNFLRSCQTVFYSNCIIFHSYQQYMGVTISPHSCQCLLFSVFLIIAILVGAKWYVIVIFICIFLMTDDVDHLFMWFLAICISSLEKCLFKSFPYFKIVLLVFLFLSCKSSLYLLDTRPVSDI